MKFADAYVEIHADTKRIKGDMTEAQTVVKGGFSKITSMAKTAGVAIAGYLGARVLFGFGKSLIAAAADSSEKLGILEQVLETTGHAAGFTVEQLDKVANDLQRVTRFSDEATKEAMAIIATFPKIKGDAFIRTTEAALDLATVMKTDAKSAAVQLAKALQDPERNLSMLNRSGISFTTQQINMVKQLIKSDKAIEAHNIILTGIEKQYGNTAKAAGKTLAGQLSIGENAFIDVKEEMGKGLVEGMGLTDMLTQMKDAADGNTSSLVDFAKGLGYLIRLIVAGIGGIVLVVKTVNNLLSGIGGAAEYGLGTMAKHIGKILSFVPGMKKLGKELAGIGESAQAGGMAKMNAKNAAIGKGWSDFLSKPMSQEEIDKMRREMGDVLPEDKPGGKGGKDGPGDVSGAGGKTKTAQTLSTIASSALAGARGIGAPGVGTPSAMSLAGGMAVAPRDEGPTRAQQDLLLVAMQQVAANTKQPTVTVLD